MSEFWWENQIRKYEVVTRHVEPGHGWVIERHPITDTYVAANRLARELAKELDDCWGSDQSWSVDCYGRNEDDAPNSSYFQLFHGRLS